MPQKISSAALRRKTKQTSRSSFDKLAVSLQRLRAVIDSAAANYAEFQSQQLTVGPIPKSVRRTDQKPRVDDSLC
jgi:hypothetical protein